MKVTVRDPGMVTLLAPAFELSLSEFDLEWAVAKPTDLSESHGINITVERLMEMAASYNPEGIEAAPINFDHDPGGPAHGWVESMEVREGLLWVRPVELSPDVVAGIRGGRYRRASIELTTKHPETGGWYLNGLAVLGNAKPAIKGLPPLRLQAPRYVIQLGDEAPAEAPEVVAETTESEEVPPIEEAPEEEKAMSKTDTKPDPTGETDVELSFVRRLMGAFKSEPAEERSSYAMTPPAAVTAEQVESLVASRVEAGIKAAMAEQLVAGDLKPFEGKATKAAIDKAKPALLRAKAEGRDEDYAAILGVLAEQDASALLGDEIASDERTSDGKSAQVSGRAARLARNEITPEREAELRRRYSIQ